MLNYQIHLLIRDERTHPEPVLVEDVAGDPDAGDARDGYEGDEPSELGHAVGYADVLAPDVELVAAARALVVAPGVLAVAVRAGARQLLPALVQVWWRWRRSRADMDGSDTVFDR